MASIRFKAGILAKNGQYFGAKTEIPSKSFELDRCTTLEVGWIKAPSDSGVGSASNALGFTEDSGVAADVVAYILYDEKFNQRDTYMITCNSAELETMQGLALTASTVPLYKSLAVATGSGYTIKP
jgi:hypothetical protein